MDIFLYISYLLLSSWSLLKWFCVFCKYLDVSDKVCVFFFKFCILGFISTLLVRHYFYRISGFDARHFALLILVLFLQFDLTLWTSLFGSLFNVMIWHSLCVGASWPEADKVKVVDELYNCIWQRWITNHESGARSVHSEMIVTRKKNGRGKDCLTSQKWLLNKPNSKATDLMVLALLVWRML